MNFDKIEIRKCNVGSDDEFIQITQGLSNIFIPTSNTKIFRKLIKKVAKTFYPAAKILKVQSFKLEDKLPNLKVEL